MTVNPAAKPRSLHFPPHGPGAARRIRRGQPLPLSEGPAQIDQEHHARVASEWSGPVRRRWQVLGTVLVLATACGCASLSSREDAAANAALRFESALTGQDGAALCAALAPGTRQELEDSTKSDCAQAVAASDVPPAAGVRRIDVYGRQARVVLDGDTLFLSAFPDGWKVTATGCEPRPRKPYKCEIKGG
jgi:hypothetical protein